MISSIDRIYLHTFNRLSQAGWRRLGQYLVNGHLQRQQITLIKAIKYVYSTVFSLLSVILSLSGWISTSQRIMFQPPMATESVHEIGSPAVSSKNRLK
jgi:hypothetical protein